MLEKIQLRIEKMTVGGAGLGRHNGLVVFVDYSAPGDLLEVELIEKKKNFAFGRILNILEKSANRTSPLCPHFGTCGGCSWQHLTHEEQLRQKLSLVEDSLKEISKLQSFDILPVKPSSPVFHYRNRVQATAVGDVWNFRKKHSDGLVPVKDCFLVEEPLRKAIQDPPTPLQNQVRYDLRLHDHNRVQLTPLLEDIELVGFSQVNRFQNQELIDHVIATIRPSASSDLFELYAGSGNFTFPLFYSRPFRHLWAIEASSILAQKAHSEIHEKNISSKKLSFHLGDVGHFLKRRWPTEDDVVFMDPPRIGAEEEVIKTLALSRPRQIVYLSCHPVTLGRDLKRLLTWNRNYRLELVQPFEMFPQTDHVETLVSLVID